MNRTRTNRAQRQHDRRLLVFARRWLGIRGKKAEVFIAAADALGISHPSGSSAGYRVLEQFHRDFKHAKGTNPPKPTYRPTGVQSDAFLLSFEWRKLRMRVLVKRGNRCECCGMSPRDGIVIHVDHIKPRRTHPELALTESNLQVLCEVCNHGKGSWDSTDWRTDSHTSGESSPDSPVTRSGDGDGNQRPVATFPRLIKRTQENRGDVSVDPEDKAKKKA